MKQILIYLLAILLLTPECTLANDPLLLSDTQMQKLKKYFPAEDESAPIVWQGNPISIMLPVGAEKRLIFPEPVQADLNGSLTTDQLRIINNDNSLYLTAKKTFSQNRMYVTLKETHSIILIDLATSDNATNTARTIILSPNKDSNTPSTSQSSNIVEAQQQNNAYVAKASNNNMVASADNYVSAIRFAWQELFAPERLLDNPMNFSRTPMHTENWVSSLVYGDKVLAHPEASWLTNGLYVTAVELRNKYPHSTSINPQHDICGNWEAVVLYPRNYLKPAGNKSGDSTMLFLISSKPFGDAMQVCYGRA